MLVAQGLPAIADLVMAHESLFALRLQLPLYLYYASLIGMVTAAALTYRALSKQWTHCDGQI